MRGVENVEQLALECSPENLGSQARAAHAKEHDAVDLAHQARGEILEVPDPLAHPQRLVQPAEPPVFVSPGPERPIPPPETFDQLGGVERGHSRPELTPRRARRTSPECLREARRTNRRTSARPLA